MKRTLLLLMPLAAFILLGLATANSGVVYEIETTYYDKRPAETAEISVEGNLLGMKQGPDATTEMVFRGDRREMVVINHEEQSYLVIDEAAIKEAAGKVNEAMAEVNKQLESLPANQRALVERMLREKGQLPVQSAVSKTEYQKTTQQATHQGYPCILYLGIVDGVTVKEMWVTDWDNVVGGPAVIDVFGDMADFYGEMIDAFSDAMGGMGGGMDGLMGGANNPFDSLSEIDGFPIVTRDFEGGELESESVFRSATERTLDPDAFEPPSGYKRQEMF